MVGTTVHREAVPIPHVPPPKRHPYDQWSPDARALDLVGDKWTLLIVRDLAAGPRRFVELQRVLPGISTEQLRSRLNRMVADGMLTRKRYREVPPRVDYELTERARELMPILGELARWGYEWAWSPPRASESVDLGAIFRLAPGLLRRAGSMRPDAAPAGTPHTDPTAGHVAAGGPASGAGGLPIATVEFVVEDPERPGDYTFTMSDEGVNLEEHAAGGADARVAGSTEAWVKAFSPERDRSGLDIAGDQQLAESLLDGLAAVGRRAAARAAQAA